MQLFLYISDFIVPFLILAIVAYGILQEVSVYDNFIIGARNGFLTVIKIMPTLIGLLLDTYKDSGTDARCGRIASISMSCTETIFYTMSVYFMTAKVTKTRYTLPGALIATLAGLAASVFLAMQYT